MRDHLSRSRGCKETLRRLNHASDSATLAAPTETKITYGVMDKQRAGVSFAATFWVYQLTFQKHTVHVQDLFA